MRIAAGRMRAIMCRWLRHLRGLRLPHLVPVNLGYARWLEDAGSLVDRVRLEDETDADGP